MKKQILIAGFCLLSLVCEAQTKKDTVKTDSVKTITLTQMQLIKLTNIEKQIQELQQAQKEFLMFIFDARSINIDKVRNLKYQDGKFTFTTEK